MFNYESKSCLLLRWGIAGTRVCLAGTAEVAADALLLPALRSVAVEVDITRLPASEEAALVPILNAARQIDAIYMQQVSAGIRTLIIERPGAVSPPAGAELDALIFFKGPWGLTGTAFIDGAPPRRPIGDCYPAGATKHEIDLWLKTLSEPNRKRALGSGPILRAFGGRSMNHMPVLLDEPS